MELPYDVGGELLSINFYQVDKSDGVFAIALSLIHILRMSNLSVDRDTLKFSQDWSKRLANGVTGVVSTMKD